MNALLVTAAFLTQMQLKAQPCPGEWLPGTPPGKGVVWTMKAVRDNGRERYFSTGAFFYPPGCLGPADVVEWDGTQFIAFGGPVPWYGASRGTCGIAGWISTGRYAGQLLISAAGEIIIDGQRLAGGLLRWDGASWRLMDDPQLSPAFFLGRYVLGVSMPDGSIVVPGAAGNASPLIKWNGQQWVGVGSAFPDAFGRTTGIVRSLLVTRSGQLLAAVAWPSSPDLPSFRVYRLSGASWVSLGVGPSESLDGGPSMPMIELSNGSIVLANVYHIGDAVRRAALWNGATWAYMGSRYIACTSVAETATGELLAAGQSGFRWLLRWNGQDWTAVPGVSVRALSVTKGPGSATWLTTDEGGSGGTPITTIAAFEDGIVRNVGEEMHGYFAGFNATTSGRFIGFGQFWSSASGAIGIGEWNGVNWQALPGPALTSRIFDPDPSVSEVERATVADVLTLGDGSLVVGGDFRRAGSTILKSVGKWNGSQWLPLGGGVEGATPDSAAFVTSLALLSNGNVVIGGNFTTAGGVVSPYLARWNGVRWSTVGTGVNGNVYDMVVLANGDLVVAGTFSTAGGIPVSNCARWNGTRWFPFGSFAYSGGNGAGVFTLLRMPNGEIVASGNFDSVDGVGSINNIAKWDGSSWNPLGTGVSRGCRTTSSSDGSLIACGMDVAGGVPTPYGVALWDGYDWWPLGSGDLPVGYLGRSVTGGCAFAPDGTLFVGAPIVFAPDGTASAGFGRLVAGPLINGQTATVEVCAPLDTMIHASVDVAGPFTQVQWQFRSGGGSWTNFTYGPLTVGGVRIGNANFPVTTDVVITLESGLVPPIAFDLRCRVTNPACGASADSMPIPVSIGSCGCHADFNGDGFLDFFDYADFVNCFELGVCPPGVAADFNLDGFVDFFDYGDFVLAFEIGC